MTHQPDAGSTDGAPPPRWGLYIATRNRKAELIHCVRCALAQTVLPLEIVISDSSSDGDLIEGELFERFGDFCGERAIRLHFMRSEVAASAHQRNDLIARSSADVDVIFLIDDDSFLHQGCAEVVLAAYAAFPSAVGVQGSHSTVIPLESSLEARRRPGASDAEARLSAIERRLPFLRRILNSEPFIFYGRGSSDLAGPWPLELGAEAGRLSPCCRFDGYRMTFRRNAVIGASFDGDFTGASYYEDIDFSYRLSEAGPLLTAHEASLHHYYASAGRDGSFTKCVLQPFNAALLIAKHSRSPLLHRLKFFLKSPRIILRSLIEDLSARPPRFPRTSGSILGYVLCAVLLALGPAVRPRFFARVTSRFYRRTPCASHGNSGSIREASPRSVVTEGSGPPPAPPRGPVAALGRIIHAFGVSRPDRRCKF